MYSLSHKKNTKKKDAIESPRDNRLVGTEIVHCHRHTKMTDRSTNKQKP